MDFIKKYKNIALSIIAIAIAAALYVTLFGTNRSDISLLKSETPSAITLAAGEDVLELLATLREIELDESIFEDPAFRSLVDFGQELVPEPVGRENPFAPIGIEGAARLDSGF